MPPAKRPIDEPRLVGTGNPFEIPPDMHNLRAVYASAIAAVKEAILVAPSRCLTLDAVDLLARENGVDHFSIKAFMLKAYNERSIIFERIPGRWRVRLLDDENRPPDSKAIIRLMGDLAAAGLEIAETAPYGLSARSTALIGDAITRARSDGLPASEIGPLIDRVFSREIGDAILSRAQPGMVRGEVRHFVAPPNDVRDAVIRAIHATTTDGIAISKLIKNFNRKFTPHDVRGEVEKLLADGTLRCVRASLPQGGRPAERLFYAL